jgi:hypothetical protein
MDLMGYDASAPAAAVRADDRARRIVDAYLPGALDSPMLGSLPFLPLAAITGGSLFAGERAPDLSEMWRELSTLEAPAAGPPVQEEPRRDPAYGSVPHRGAVRGVTGAERWGVAEVVLEGPSHGNPFVDVDLTAQFTHDEAAPVTAGGFYDGDGVYRVRFQPPATGEWSFRTASNVPGLDGLQGTLTVGPATAGNHGPVGVVERFHFAHADGTRHLPLGTTAYAWTHQSDELQERTLRTLAGASFTKVRMCVFPKSYLYNSNEPALHAYEQRADGTWDLSRFNIGFFRHLERRILDLQALGIEADLILFHAYDRWGYSRMPAWADDMYLTYLSRRLGAVRSVWWSLANEYDLLPQKSVDDWERFATVLGRENHAPHLTSIHNCFAFYDHSRPWVTHCSIQRIDVYRTAEFTDEWREQYGKPVVIDECAYEGDIDQGWGNISGPELVRRAWEGAVRGGYVNHGETYYNEREELWWAKGGDLVGHSPARIAFLAQITAEVPGGVLEPLPGDWDARWAGTPEHRLVYFGFGRPLFRTLVLPPGSRWHIDVIDTWNMTVTPLDGTSAGRVTVRLPGREYMALRLRRA